MNMLAVTLLSLASVVAATDQQPQHLFVLDHNASRGGTAWQLREVSPKTGEVVSAKDVAFPDRGRPGWVLVNNNYDFAVDPDPVHGAFYIMARYGTAIPHQEKTNYSLPMLLRVDKNTGVVTEVASIAKANYRHAYDNANDHIAFDQSSGKVIVLSRNYEDPDDELSKLSYFFSSVDPNTGKVEDLGEMPMGECAGCRPDSGEAVISENAAYAPDLGLFCDVSLRNFNGMPAHNYYDSCWDFRSGAVKSNVSDVYQFTSMRYDSAKKRIVGLGLCCDPTVPGGERCPKACIGRGNNRTWLSWNVGVNEAPQLIRIVDPLPSEEMGPTWLPLGAALDESSRIFSYVSITASKGATITGIQFVHLDIDSGEARGRAVYDITGPSRWGWGGVVFRYGYAAPSTRFEVV